MSVTLDAFKKSTSLCYSVTEFCRKFSRLPKVLHATFDGTNAGQVRSCFAAYMDIVKDQVCRKEKDIAEEVLEGVMKGLEDHVTRTMHGDVVATWASGADLDLWRKAQKLKDWGETEFGLSNCRMEGDVMDKAGSMLEQLPLLMTPHEKLSLISDFTSLLLTDLLFCHSLSHDSHPDTCLQVLAFALVRYLGGKEQPAQLHSSLSFVYTFGTYRQPTLRETFSFSLFQGALSYIENL